MAQVNLNLAHITDDGLIAGALKYKTSLTGNAPFADVTPNMTDYGALIADAQAKVAAAKVAETAALTATTAKNAAIAALHDGTVQLGGSVQSISKGNPVLIESAGMAVKAAATPVGQLGQVQKLSLTTGDNPGEVDAQWDSMSGQKIFEVQKCTGDPTVEANWSFIKNSSPSKTTTANQPSGTRLWLRVRAKAPKDENDGPWSQPATIIVP